MEAEHYGTAGAIGVLGTEKEWQEILLDLIEMRQQIHYYRSLREVNDTGTYEYEAATTDLIERLQDDIGVTI